MPAEQTLIGLIEVDIPEGRSLASVLETLVSASPGPRTVMCRVRRETPQSSISADIPQLTESLESEYDALQQRMQRGF